MKSTSNWRGTTMAMKPVSSQVVELLKVGGTQNRTNRLTNKFEVDKFDRAERQQEDEMKKQMLRGLAMLMLVVALATATSANSPTAPSARHIQAEIPFEFSIGYKTMAAGEYRIQIVTSANDAVLIQRVDGKSSALRLSEATSGNAKKNKSQVRLVFHRYGERYFLAEVWNGSDTGRALLKSQEEKAIERELASNASSSDSAKVTLEIVEVVASHR